MRRAGALLLLATLCSCVSTPPPPAWHAVAPSAFDHPLTLAECVALARANDVRASQWQARLDAAHAGISSAKALPNPTVNLEWEAVGLRDLEGRSVETHKTFVSYPIFFWWPRAYKVAEAEANRQAEADAVRSEQRQLVAEVGASWFGLVADQRGVQLSGVLLANAQESLRLANKGKELGIRSAYDVERADAEVLKAQANQNDAETALRIDQLAFAFAIGVQRPCFPKVADTEEAGAAAPGALGDAEVLPDDLLALALAADPDWAKAKRLVDAAEAELHVQQLGAVPLSDVRAAGGAIHQLEGDGGLANGEVPVPLLNWNRPAIDKASADLLSARTEEEKARRAVVASLSQDWERVRAAVRKWTLFAHPLSDKLSKVEASARKLFDAGQIGYQELLQAQRDLTEARRTEVDAWKDASTARWTLESALGRHDPPPEPARQ